MIPLSNLKITTMADYLLIFRGGESGELKQQSPEKWQAHMQKWAQWMGILNEQGKFGGAQPLKSGGKVIKGSSKTETDGPFIEGKEMVGGYLICKGVGYEEAVEIAKGCPILVFDNGIVEVREIGEIHM
jgi:hypothetical protein